MHPTASRVETGCVAPHLDEHLLRDLLGLGGIAHDAQHGAVERGRQLVVELGERMLVALAIRAINAPGSTFTTASSSCVPARPMGPDSQL